VLGELQGLRVGGGNGQRAHEPVEGEAGEAGKFKKGNSWPGGGTPGEECRPLVAIVSSNRSGTGRPKRASKARTAPNEALIIEHYRRD